MIASLIAGRLPALALPAAGILAAAAVWIWIERGAAADWRARAEAADRAASDARAAAVANAAAAQWQRRQAAAAQLRIARLEADRGRLGTRTVTIVREIRREKDALDPVGPALRLAARRLRELDAGRPGAAGADAAAAAERAAGDPAAPAAAR